MSKPRGAHRAPAYMHFVLDGLALSSHLGGDAFKAFWSLAWRSWVGWPARPEVAQCFLPGDDATLQAFSGLDARRWPAVRAQVLQLFRTQPDGRYACDFMLAVLGRQRHVSDVRADAGQLGGLAKAANRVATDQQTDSKGLATAGNGLATASKPVANAKQPASNGLATGQQTASKALAKASSSGSDSGSDSDPELSSPGGGSDGGHGSDGTADSDAAAAGRAIARPGIALLEELLRKLRVRRPLAARDRLMLADWLIAGCPVEVILDAVRTVTAKARTRGESVGSFAYVAGGVGEAVTGWHEGRRSDPQIDLEAYRAHVLVGLRNGRGQGIPTGRLDRAIDGVEAAESVGEIDGIAQTLGAGPP